MKVQACICTRVTIWSSVVSLNIINKKFALHFSSTLIVMDTFSLFFPQGKRQTWYNSTLASRRKRLTAHFEDLEQCYFSNKMSRITGASPAGRSHSTATVCSSGPALITDDWWIVVTVSQWFVKLRPHLLQTQPLADILNHSLVV